MQQVWVNNDFSTPLVLFNFLNYMRKKNTLSHVPVRRLLVIFVRLLDLIESRHLVFGSGLLGNPVVVILSESHG